jgi:hypothetical protein
MQNFVKLESLTETVNERWAGEDKLRHIVPPAVRLMQEEVKAQLSEILNQQYEIENKTD